MIAGLARFCNGDIGRAEELAQDALVSALETWPAEGVPRNPGAWLMTTAKNRQIDLARRSRIFHVKVEELGRELPVSAPEPDPEAIDDDLLSLVFTTCHPVLSQDAQVALTLRMVGGLKTEEIARAFLVSDKTIGQRISRAKRTLADAEVPFEVPPPDERPARIAAVLAVVYLIYNEGYAATAGEDWMRLDLCEDALRLGRMLQQLMPREAEVHGLAALMELQSSRLRARTAPDGSAILLLDQNRQRWDRLLIDRGLAAIERAKAIPGGTGPYTLQAEIAACHARARRSEETDWHRIAALYRDLSNRTGSPVVELNRAVAVGMASGPEAGLRVLDAIADDPALAEYHLLPSVRGDLLEKAGRGGEAAEEFDRAAAMTRNEREREVLSRRRDELRAGS
ncbi:MAG: RNA polymerase sigma factor [Thermoleophilaceae bacterium]|nr:RNA polymerase sigma factor [Thermoleophilaceae bacterium]